MRHVLVRQLLAGSICGICQKHRPRPVGQSAKGDDRLDGRGRNDRREPLIAVLRDIRITDVLIAPALAIDAVEKSVQQNIAAANTKLGKKSLNPMTGGAYENAADDRLMLGRILSDAKQVRRTIKPAAVKDRPPLRAKGGVGIDGRVRRLVAQ